jgi:hypothetical protein
MHICGVDFVWVRRDRELGDIGCLFGFGALDLSFLVCFLGELVSRFVFRASRTGSGLCSVGCCFIVGVSVLRANLRLCWNLDCWLYWIRFEFLSFFSFSV